MTLDGRKQGFVENQRPGNTAVIQPVSGTISVKNTTTGRELPPGGLGPIRIGVLYDASTGMCKSTDAGSWTPFPVSSKTHKYCASSLYSADPPYQSLAANETQALSGRAQHPPAVTTFPDLSAVLYSELEESKYASVWGSSPAGYFIYLSSDAANAIPECETWTYQSISVLASSIKLDC